MKKLCIVLAVAILLVTALCLGVNASADEWEPPCGGVIVMVDAEFSCIPLKSRIAFGDSMPDLSGSVLEIICSDDEVKRVTVEKDEAGYSAGDFIVSFSEYGNVETEIFLGIKKVEAKVNVCYKAGSYMSYEGTAAYTYIKIPSLF